MLWLVQCDLVERDRSKPASRRILHAWMPLYEVTAKLMEQINSHLRTQLFHWQGEAKAFELMVVLQADEDPVPFSAGLRNSSHETTQTPLPSSQESTIHLRNTFASEAGTNSSPGTQAD